jgi:PAS domain S-box-containing protein
VLANSNDAIYALVRDFSILSWNKGSERMFGYMREEILGEPLDVLLPDAEARNQLEKLIRERINLPREQSIRYSLKEYAHKRRKRILVASSLFIVPG